MSEQSQPGTGHSLAGIASWVARLLIVPLLLGVAASVLGLVPSFQVTAAGPPTSPHAGYSDTTDTCAACHRSHTARNTGLLSKPAPQSNFCFTCHDGTGASNNVAAEYSSDYRLLGRFENKPGTSEYYSHAATALNTGHTSGLANEFGGKLNRHSECSDCHNPHSSTSSATVSTASGWTASGSLAGTTGASKSVPPVTVKATSYEYELCFKCHSSYTQLLTETKESYKKFDKAAEFAIVATNASYHPIEGAGTNQTPRMALSLSGGKLWQFTTGSTVRCTNCHGDSRVVGSSPQPAARLAPHTSPNRGILIAPYTDRVLKMKDVAYNTNDFTLCFLCHSEAPFLPEGAPGASNAATNFKEHAKHVSGLAGEGSGSSSTDIDVAGAGQGNAICAECHYQLHSTKSAYRVANQAYQRLVNFAPNVQPNGVNGPAWTTTATSGSCTLTCHGRSHSSESDGRTTTAAAPAAAGSGPVMTQPASAADGVGARVASGSPPTPTPGPPPTLAPTATPVRQRATPTPAPISR